MKSNYLKQFIEWYDDFKTNNHFDEQKFNEIANGLDCYWQEVCTARQLSLDVLKNDNLQKELNNDILNYKNLNQAEQVQHNLRFIINLRKLKEYALEILTFDEVNNKSIGELEDDIAKAKVIVSLHEFKNGNSNLPLYKSFINVHEQVLNLKKLNNRTALVDECTISKNKTLFDNLFTLDFWNLFKTKSLSHDSQSKLIELLVLNETPYSIAMFEYVGFFRYLESEKRLTKTDIFKKLAAIFECSKDCIKGNYYALDEHSKYDKSRYTSHLHKEKVKTDYHSLK